MVEGNLITTGDEADVQRPVRQTFCDAFQRDANWKCLILSLLIYGCLGAITWCRLSQVTKDVINWRIYPIKSTRHVSPCEDGYIYIPIAFMGLLYLVYLVECWHCTARVQLSCKVDITSVIEKIRLMRQSVPIVWWKAVCYHYVRRKKHVTRYRNGEAYTSSQVYYERVNSHAAGSVFMFAYCGCKDISRNLVLDPNGPIIKIRFSKGFAFANVEAAAEFEDQRSRFFSEHERYDDYMEMKEGLDLSYIPHFKEYMVAYADPDHLPWYSKQNVFWILSFLLLSWPLRMMVEYNTVYVHYRVTKLFGINYNEITPTREIAEPAPVQVASPPRLVLPHVTTLDSADWENSIQDNDALVPSYSEAMLLTDDGEDKEKSRSGFNCPSTNRCEFCTSKLYCNHLKIFRRYSLDGVQKPKSNHFYNNILFSENLEGIIGESRINENRENSMCCSFTMPSGNNLLDKNLPVIRRERSNFVKVKINVKNRRSWSGWTSQSKMDDHVILPIKNTDINGTRIKPDPPSYNEALNLPVLTKLRRSLTERGEIWRKALLNRLSGDFGTAYLNNPENNEETNV